MRRRLAAMLLAWLFAGLAPAFADQAPRRLVVPYPPGGPTDAVARAYAERLSALLNQPFVVENRPGANGAIAGELVAKATPDGTTMMVATPSGIVVNPILRKLSFDTDDFAPVSLICEAPIVFTVNNNLPVRSVTELIAYSKAKPDALNFGSDGHGATTHLAGELLKKMTGLQMTHVPYKGTAEVINAVTSGELQVAVSGALNALPLVSAGRLRMLAIAGSRRLPQLPDVLTVAEAGVPGYDVTSWFAIVAPARTDPTILARVSAAVREAATSPEIVSRLSIAATFPQSSTPDELRAMIKADRERWATLIRDAQIRVD